MKPLIILLCFLSFSCTSKQTGFEKDYYERITKITLPEKYTLLESFDNGEFLTGSVFQMDSLSLEQIILTHQLDSVRAATEITNFGESVLKNNKPVFKSFKNIFFKRGIQKTTNWIAIASLQNYKLWIIIDYPDWSGK